MARLAEVGGSRKQRNNDVSLGLLLALISFLFDEEGPATERERRNEGEEKESMAMASGLGGVRGCVARSALPPSLFTAFGRWPLFVRQTFPDIWSSPVREDGRGRTDMAEDHSARLVPLSQMRYVS